MDLPPLPPNSLIHPAKRPPESLIAPAASPLKAHGVKGSRTTPPADQLDLRTGAADQATQPEGSSEPAESQSKSSPSMREVFQDFVGQTLFGSMLASMRKTVGKPAYLHGGRTEEVFQKQLDQYLVEDLSDASAETISEPMYELFTMQRRAG